MRWGMDIIRVGIGAVVAACLASTTFAQQPLLAQPQDVYIEGQSPSATSSSGGAYPQGDFYQQLHVASGQTGSSTDWGSGGSPHRTGPGRGDDWRVGPRWRVLVDGLIMSREETNLSPLASALGTTLASAEQFENFEHGAGVRILGAASWPQYQGYEMALGYVGVEEWNANIILPTETLPADPGPPESVAVDQRRSLTYNSSLHSLELNWQGVNETVWKPYAGIRYFSLDEVVEDRTSQSPAAPLITGESAVTNSLLHASDVENHLIGFQLGLRRDLWQVSRKVYVQGFASAGVYGNLINRADVERTSTTTTEVLEDDPETEDIDETGQIDSFTSTTGNRVKTERTDVSFASEAAITLVWKINDWCALRSGYEVLVINGVELADDAFLNNVQSRDLLYHGGFAGFEYRR